MASIVLCTIVQSGCARDDDAIRADVQLLALLDGEAGQSAAAERLVRHGRRALPSVEAALHTAEPPGRKNMILVLRRIGDPDAVPLLRHVALFDAALDVRREAEWTLKSWAAGQDGRAERARAALRELDERRAREEAG
jgi:hypothetical protein